MKVLLWNGGNFFVDNTELRFYLRMAVNYRGNLFDNIGSRWWLPVQPYITTTSRFWPNLRSLHLPPFGMFWV